MVNIAVVEDEDLAAATLIGFVNKYCERNELQVNITRFPSATLLLRNYKPNYDIIFMDIMLPNLNGMDAAKRLRELDTSVILIFVTNMANFAVKGYEVDALDFIVKPVVYDSFAMKMRKAIRATNTTENISVKIQLDGALKVIPISKVYYAEVNRHSLIFHTEDGKFSERGTISGLEKQLSDKSFGRCNVCFLVNLKHVTEVAGDNLTVGGDTLKISRARRKEFMQQLTNYLGKSV